MLLLYLQETDIPLTRGVNASLRARMSAVVDLKQP